MRPDMNMNTSVLGIVGGLGPLATVDFLNKLIHLTDAKCDQDHISWSVMGIPQTPDRTTCILAKNDVPFEYLSSAVQVLNQQSVSAITIICNTAHYWHERLQAESKAPIFHIADSAINALSALPKRAKVAILSTRGTLIAGFYQNKLLNAGFEPILLETIGKQEDMDECIRLVKAHDVEKAATHCKIAMDACSVAGCAAVIMACTEIPIAQAAMRDIPHLVIVDANLELAKTCVRQFKRL
jgi:aspartate racemase